MDRSCLHTTFGIWTTCQVSQHTTSETADKVQLLENGLNEEQLFLLQAQLLISLWWVSTHHNTFRGLQFLSYKLREVEEEFPYLHSGSVILGLYFTLEDHWGVESGNHGQQFAQGHPEKHAVEQTHPKLVLSEFDFHLTRPCS